jgi:alpha-amylase
VVINGDTESLTHTFQTQLPPGRYCNVAVGNLTEDGQACQNQIEPIQVNASGQFTATLDGLSAVALHVGTKIPVP